MIDLLDYLEQCTQSSDHPGGVLAVSWEDGQALFSEFGVPHHEAGKDWVVVGAEGDPRIEDLLPTGPCARWIFAIDNLVEPMLVLTTMALVEDEQLSLSDPVSRYIPEFAAPEVYFELDGGSGSVRTRPAKREILIEDLLAHRSGIPLLPVADWRPFDAGALEQGLHHALAEVPRRARDESLGDFARRLAALPLRADPGAQRALGEGHEVLGAILEQVTGRRLPQILAARIFDPLGMVDTGFDLPDDKRARVMPLMRYLPIPVACPPPANWMLPYVQGPDEGEARHSARSGCFSSASDLLLFAELLAGRGERAGVRIVSTESFELGLESFLQGVAPKQEAGSNPSRWADGLWYSPRWTMGGTDAGFFARASPPLAGVLLWRISTDGNCANELGSHLEHALRTRE